VTLRAIASRRHPCYVVAVVTRVGASRVRVTQRIGRKVGLSYVVGASRFVAIGPSPVVTQLSDARDIVTHLSAGLDRDVLEGNIRGAINVDRLVYDSCGKVTRIRAARVMARDTGITVSVVPIIDRRVMTGVTANNGRCRAVAVCARSRAAGCEDAACAGVDILSMDANCVYAMSAGARAVVMAVITTVAVAVAPTRRPIGRQQRVTAVAILVTGVVVTVFNAGVVTSQDNSCLAAIHMVCAGITMAVSTAIVVSASRRIIGCSSSVAARLGAVVDAVLTTCRVVATDPTTGMAVVTDQATHCPVATVCIGVTAIGTGVVSEHRPRSDLVGYLDRANRWAVNVSACAHIQRTCVSMAIGTVACIVGVVHMHAVLSGSRLATGERASHTDRQTSAMTVVTDQSTDSPVAVISGDVTGVGTAIVSIHLRDLITSYGNGAAVSMLANRQRTIVAVAVSTTATHIGAVAHMRVVLASIRANACGEIRLTAAIEVQTHLAVAIGALKSATCLPVVIRCGTKVTIVGTAWVGVTIDLTANSIKCDGGFVRAINMSTNRQRAAVTVTSCTVRDECAVTHMCSVLTADRANRCREGAVAATVEGAAAAVAIGTGQGCARRPLIGVGVTGVTVIGTVAIATVVGQTGYSIDTVVRLMSSMRAGISASAVTRSTATCIVAIRRHVLSVSTGIRDDAITGRALEE